MTSGERTLRFEGRTAIVTGAGLGIGRSIALRLAREGADIGILDLSAEDGEETAAAIRALGRRAFVVTGNVSLKADVDRGIEALVSALGNVDILVNNAGILRMAPFLETTPEMWRSVLGVNLDGVYHGCQAVLPHMLRQKRGTIVNMSSWTGKKGVPNHSAYSVSKFGVIGLTQAIAGEMAAHGIRVNAVCPGTIVDTKMRDEHEALCRAQGLPDIATRVKTIPLQRPGYPEDVASTVAFLASDEAAYMTGQAINITGGLWMN